MQPSDDENVEARRDLASLDAGNVIEPGARDGEVEHVKAWRRDAGGPGVSTQISTGKSGCVVPLAIWTGEWMVIAGFAVWRLHRSSDFSAFVSVLVSAGIAVSALRLCLALARGRQFSMVQMAFGSRSGYQRAAGWVSGILWAVIIIVWNVGTFWILADAARKARAWLIILMAVWSLLALFLLFVLAQGIGSRIRAMRERN